MSVWDIGGQTAVRVLWKHYFLNTQALIFVVDSFDTSRFQEASEELKMLLESETLEEAPLLIYANKQDLPGAAKLSTLVDVLDLHSHKKRKWHVQACCATTGDGLYPGLDWLSRALET
eukprot:CAMPEP_0168526944 /NCGR_PEP_ID=MMETSP0405-20121227/12291_1 /TAXON_ID=498012 /ORGANISM="Trichosphaerium sp, Strain Am-I-7 wt" /LENGTH=117 /DNA_ID=CAMNT_0008549927 /DNA_START=276 /DNA_END=632 /DNA_ORIENTATION=+